MRKTVSTVKHTYKLIALDMDGTLLKSDKSVHKDTIRDIRQASKKGIDVVYCSGRAVPEILPYVPCLPTIRYAVCMSGACVYDFEEKKSIYRKGIAAEYVRMIVRVAEEQDGMIHFLTDNESVVRADQVTHMADFQMGIYQPMFLKLTRTVEDMMSEAEDHESVPKVNIYFRTRETRQQGYDALRHLPLSFAFAGETGLEMTAQGVTKATGLQILAEYLAKSMEDVLGIGDSDNDREVLEAVGFAVAMGNADQDIKELCDAVTKDNDHNGVGEAIQKYVFLSS